MKKLILGTTAVALAFLAPLSKAKADGLSYDPFCTTGLVLNFCGSVVVTTATTGDGGTDVVMTVLNTSGSSAGGDPLAVFTAIGLENVSNAGTFSNLQVWMGGTDYSSYWQLNLDKTIGGGVNVDVLSRTDNGIQWGISSACGPIDKRITTGGIGSCGYTPNVVTISFHVTGTFAVSGGNVFIKAQGNNSSECLLGTACSTTTTPEPATILLVGSGLLSLGGMSRWRRRRDDNDGTA